MICMLRGFLTPELRVQLFHAEQRFSDLREHDERLAAENVIAIPAQTLVLAAEELRLHRAFVEDPKLAAVHGDRESGTCSETARRRKSRVAGKQFRLPITSVPGPVVIISDQ